MANTKTPGVITCKAAVAWKPSEPLMVEEILVEPPKPNEVRIKMLAASMCHTDILGWNGVQPLFPRILGHEGAGVIESVGEKVRDLKAGDKVMALYVGECGQCPNCATGKTNLCYQFPPGASGLMADGTSRMSVKGHKLYHMISCSTWSEYTVTDSNFVVKIDPRMSLPQASLLTCGFTTGYGAAWKALQVGKGSTVAVLGLGAVGLGAVSASSVLGASKIIGVDINELKRDKGRAFGMTDFINPKHSDKTVSQLIQEATGGLGVDYCIECTGVPSLLDQAIASTKAGVGEAVMISAGDKEKGEITYIHLLSGRTVKGSIFGDVRIHSDLPKIVDKCINKEIDLDELITHEVSLADINKGLEYMKQPQPDCVKVMIKF